MIWPNCCVCKISKTYKLLLIFSTRRSTIYYQVSPLNLHRNNLVEMSTVSTYNILSFCINCHFCFLIILIFFSMSSFKSRIRRKSQSFPKSLKKNTLSELGVEISTFVPCERRWSWYRMTYCHVKYTGCVTYGALSYSTGRGTVWRLVILHWLCYRMTHCQVKGTGRGTVWHIAMWKALVMVPYDTLPGERH
jgi:hypothetical protein